MRSNSSEQNLDTTRLMQSSHRPMKESREMGRVGLVLARIIELRMSYVMALESSNSVDVVKKSSFPCGKSR